MKRMFTQVSAEAAVSKKQLLCVKIMVNK